MTVEIAGERIGETTGGVRAIPTRRGIQIGIETGTEIEAGTVETAETETGVGTETCEIETVRGMIGTETAIEGEVEMTEEMTLEQEGGTATMLIEIETAAVRETGQAATTKCALGFKIKAGEEGTKHNTV
jgi:hypothetical protein